MNSTTPFSTGTGKIARPPREIRQPLNDRLADATGQELVAWPKATAAVSDAQQSTLRDGAGPRSRERRKAKVIAPNRA